MDDEFRLKRNGSEAMLIETWHDVPHQNINAVFQWENPEDVPLRIGICGSHGTQKTQLARRLAKQLELPVIEEVARGVRDLGFRLNKSTSLDTQILIWLGSFYEQLKEPEFVADRTLLDHLAYLESWAKGKNMGLESHLVTTLKNLTNAIMEQEYTVIFYVPIDKAPASDGVRSVDRKYQQQIDELIIKYLDSFSIDYFPLLGNLDQKCRTAIDYIKEAGLGDHLD